MRFAYTGIMAPDRRVSGTLKSRNRLDALRQLLNRGCHPLTIEEVEEDALSVERLATRFLRRVSVSDLAVFSRQLAALLKAGLPLIKALNTLRRQSANRRLARVIQDVEETLATEGGTLADALDEHPRVFNSVYRGLVRAGEEGGSLIEVLSDLAGHLSRSAKLGGQVRGAFIYPAFLLCLGVGAVFILMTFVIPRFQYMFTAMGHQLPWPTRVLIAVSTFMASWWWGVLIAVATAAALAVGTLRRPVVRKYLDRSLLRLPVLGPMVLKLEIVRIARTLGALLTGGVQVLEALRITGDAAKNLALRDTFPTIIKDTSGGEPLADGFQKSGLYPPLMVNLIKTGEDTGELPAMLTELASIYEDEAERAVGVAVRLLEPLLIVTMGGVISAIVAAVMLPIFQTYSLVQ